MDTNSMETKNCTLHSSQAQALSRKEQHYIGRISPRLVDIFQGINEGYATIRRGWEIGYGLKVFVMAGGTRIQYDIGILLATGAASSLSCPTLRRHEGIPLCRSAEAMGCHLFFENLFILKGEQAWPGLYLPFPGMLSQGC